MGILRFSSVRRCIQACGVHRMIQIPFFLSRLRTAVAPGGDQPELDLSIRNSDPEHALTRVLLYYLMPLWMGAGLLDWYWHKKTDIEHTAGTEESLIHLLMFTEAGLPLMMGLLLEINAGSLLAMMAALGVHEVTAIWDVAYASNHRLVLPREQHTHSFLEVLPFMAFAMASCLHWDQLQALLGVEKAKPDWRPKFKQKRVPAGYMVAIAGMIGAGILLPYGNEILRCLRASKEPHYDGSCKAPLETMPATS